MKPEEFEEFIRRNPDEARRLISKAFEPKELLTVGNRSYIDAYKYPESRFDPLDLCSNGHNCPNLDMLQPLSDPGKLFTDKYVIPPSSLIFPWANKIYDKKWWGEVAGGSTDAGAVTQAAINALTSGVIYLKDTILPQSLTLKDRVLIIEDYRGQLTYYGATKQQLNLLANNEATVTFQFDDAYVSTYTIVLPKFKARNWKGALVVPINNVDTLGRLTTAQIREMAQSGWDIINHGNMHISYDTLTRQQIEADIIFGKNWIENNIQTPCLMFKAPFWTITDKYGVSCLDLINAYHPYCFGGYGTSWDGRPNSATAQIGLLSVTNLNYTNVPTWLAWATTAEKCVIFQFHSIDVGNYNITEANFDQVIAWVEASGLPVVTTSQYSSKYGVPTAFGKAGANFWKVTNRVRGIIPTFDTFDTNPSNPQLMTDGDFTTETGEGIRNIGAPGAAGNIMFDMGAAYPVTVRVWCNCHRVSGDGTLQMIVEHSDDGATFRSSGVYSKSGISTDAYTSMLEAFLYARYFRLRFNLVGTSVASVYHIKVAEVQAIQLTS